ncbi:MAG: WbuC family cupin fold metalloprotein [Sulfurifustis sp.]
MSDIKRIDTADLRELVAQAAANPRRRKNFNVHDSPADPVQRFLNAFEPGTYIRPHRHPDKWELFVLLQGEAIAFVFDENGRVLDRADLNDTGSGVRVVEIPAGAWHSLVSLTSGTVLFEVKRGPYDPAAPAEYASWSPAEADPSAAAFERRLRGARIGELLVPANQDTHSD